MGKRKPLHPGKALKNILERLNLSQSEAADRLGIHRKTLSEFVNEKTSCSVEMASRLAFALDMNAAAWINMQANYNAWVAENSEVTGVEKFPTEPLKKAS
jgi:addiction module HigA family antidote